jgi:uncharacterized protein
MLLLFAKNGLKSNFWQIMGVFKETTKIRKSVFLTMITTFGLAKNEYTHSIVQNEITMDDLFGSW